MTKIKKSIQTNGTFGIIYQKILRDSRLTLKGKAVYAMLTTYTNSESKCWPSLTRLKKDLGIHKSTVILGIRELINAGIITRETGKNNSSIYTLPSSTGDVPLSGQVVQEMYRSSTGDVPLSSTGGVPKHIKENITNNTNIAFEVFWNLYDKKKGSKKACEKKWDNLKDSERQKAIDTIPVFKASIEEKRYQPYPETYINKERWNDEIDEILKPASMRIL